MFATTLALIVAAGGALLIPSSTEDFHTKGGSTTGMPIGDVGIASDGTRVVVWEEKRIADSSPLSTISYQLIYPDGTNTAVLQVAAPTTNILRYEPTVGMAEDGSFIIAWVEEIDANDTDIAVQRFNRDGTKRGITFNPSSIESSKDQRNPQVALFGNGDMFITWETIYSETTVNMVTTYDRDIHLGLYWTDPSDGNFKAYDDNGTDRGDVRIAGSSQDETSPEVAANPATSVLGGETAAVLVFRRYADNGMAGFQSNITGVRFTNTGAPILGAFTANADNSPNIDLAQPRVAMDADGDFVVAWTQGGTTGITYHRRFNSAGVPLDAFDVRPADAISDGLLSRPVVAMDRDGRYVVGYDLISNSLYSEFDAAGTRLSVYQNTPLIGSDWNAIGTNFAMSRNGSRMAAAYFYNFGNGGWSCASRLFHRVDSSRDTDGDGLSDDFEGILNSNPGDANDLPAVLDMNFDGQVNSADAIHWYRHLVNSGAPRVPGE